MEHIWYLSFNKFPHITEQNLHMRIPFKIPQKYQNKHLFAFNLENLTLDLNFYIDLITWTNIRYVVHAICISDAKYLHLKIYPFSIFIDDIPLYFSNCSSCINPIIYGVYYFSERNSTVIGNQSNPAQRGLMFQTSRGGHGQTRGSSSLCRDSLVAESTL